MSRPFSPVALAVVALVVACADGSAPTDATTDTDTDRDTDVTVDTDVGDTDTTDTDTPRTCTTSNTTDVGNDGTIDNRREQVDTATTRHVDLDTNGDGTVDQTQDTTWTPDRSFVLLTEWRAQPAGTLQRRTVGEVDAQGRRIRQAQDNDADGHAESVTLWTYHPDGTQAEERYETDSDDDGTVDRVRLRTFDTAGRIVRDAFDDDVDGTFDHWETWTWSENDSYVVASYEAPDVLSRQERERYDAQGRWIEQAYDNDGDGTFTSTRDEVFTFTYGANGKLATSDYDGRLGTAPDGQWDLRTTYAYDAHANLLQTVTADRAGTVTERQTWTYDGDDNQVSQEDDLDADGTIQSGWRATYDGAHHMLTHVEIQGGVDARREAWTYDSHGFSDGYSLDDDADGTIDQRQSVDNDAWGRGLVSRIDQDGDGTWDQVTTSTFSCPPDPFAAN